MQRPVKSRFIAFAQMRRLRLQRIDVAQAADRVSQRRTCVQLRSTANQRAPSTASSYAGVVAVPSTPRNVVIVPVPVHAQLTAAWTGQKHHGAAHYCVPFLRQ